MKQLFAIIAIVFLATGVVFGQGIEGSGTATGNVLVNVARMAKVEPNGEPTNTIQLYIGGSGTQTGWFGFKITGDGTAEIDYLLTEDNHSGSYTWAIGEKKENGTTVASTQGRTNWAFGGSAGADVILTVDVNYNLTPNSSGVGSSGDFEVTCTISNYHL